MGAASWVMSGCAGGVTLAMLSVLLVSSAKAANALLERVASWERVRVEMGKSGTAGGARVDEHVAGRTSVHGECWFVGPAVGKTRVGVMAGVGLGVPTLGGGPRRVRHGCSWWA